MSPNSQDNSREPLSVAAYEHLLNAAIERSPSLHDRLAAMGPIQIPIRSADSLLVFLVRAVIRQQLSRRAAQGIQGRLEDAIGRHGGDLPEFLQSKYAAEIRAAGLAAQKVKTLIAIGEAFTGGVLREEALAAESPEARSRTLTSIWGIGRWTADMAAMSFFLDPDVWPDGDRTVKVTFNSLVGAPIEAPTVECAATFSPHRSALARYMWKIADEGAKS